LTFKKGETAKRAKPFPKSVNGDPARRPPGLHSLDTQVRRILKADEELPPAIAEATRSAVRKARHQGWAYARLQMRTGDVALERDGYVLDQGRLHSQFRLPADRHLARGILKLSERHICRCRSGLRDEDVSRLKINELFNWFTAWQFMERCGFGDANQEEGSDDDEA
jgi:hypothetical protein